MPKPDDAPLQDEGRERLASAFRWTPAVAEEIAAGAGIGSLNERHWTVIAVCREDAARRGEVPSPERLVELTGLGQGELDRLFSGDSGRWVARIAGLRDQADPI